MNVFDVLVSSQSLANPMITSGVHSVLIGLVSVLLGLVSWGLKVLVNLINVEVDKRMHGLQGFIAKRIVLYVEQKLSDAASPEKFKAAAEAMAKTCPRLSSDEVQHAIEEAVFEMKVGQPGPATKPADTLPPAPIDPNQPHGGNL
jgi:hypothetical protein